MDSQLSSFHYRQWTWNVSYDLEKIRTMGFGEPVYYIICLCAIECTSFSSQLPPSSCVPGTLFRRAVARCSGMNALSVRSFFCWNFHFFCTIRRFIQKSCALTFSKIKLLFCIFHEWQAIGTYKTKQRSIKLIFVFAKKKTSFQWDDIYLHVWVYPL